MTFAAILQIMAFFPIFLSVEWTIVGGKESGTEQAASQVKMQYLEKTFCPDVSPLYYSTPQNHDSYRGRKKSHCPSPPKLPRTLQIHPIVHWLPLLDHPWIFNSSNHSCSSCKTKHWGHLQECQLLGHHLYFLGSLRNSEFVIPHSYPYSYSCMVH